MAEINYYKYDDLDFSGPAPIEVKEEKGKEIYKGIDRQGKPSIFNRYSIFFYNGQQSDATMPEDFYDSPDRIGDAALKKVRNYPSAQNIIEWSKSGKANAIDYAWEDFLWCKNYGKIPNNYMVTLRRFTVPPEDDLSHTAKNTNPDVARLITWVDGETNKWENVGLKWSHNLNFKELTADLQTKESQPGYGNESGAFEGSPLGGMLKTFSSLSDFGASKAAASNNPQSNSFDPYQNSNVVFGPIDRVMKMQVREKGLDFSQDITLVFEFELRSIDGINPKVAMLDLLSNVMICTMNRGSWWGGDVRYYGGNPRQLKPIGDPSKLASGDVEGYWNSFVKGFQGRLDALSGGKGIFSWEGAKNALKNVAGNFMSQLAGGALDKMGRPGIQAVNALLSGESTGEWHITVGNPANPIISIGNLILSKTEVDLNGPLGFDDFPTKVKVTCTLKPARPRDRTEIMAMFSRNGRTYLTAAPQSSKYAGNRPRGGQNGGKTPPGNNADTLKQANLETKFPKELLALRFPNHKGDLLDNTAKHIF
jgi:hypothetical protein